jgi:hypothetical protein
MCSNWSWSRGKQALGSCSQQTMLKISKCKKSKQHWLRPESFSFLGDNLELCYSKCTRLSLTKTTFLNKLVPAWCHRRWWLICLSHVFWYDIFSNLLISSFSESAISNICFWISVKCLYNKQNNTWTLGDMLYSSSISPVTCGSLRSLVRSRTWTFEDKFHISTYATMYYFLFISLL